jgi:DNA-directed RNA polymerase subunit M/transcription elongation factor TFIIS
MICVKCGEAMRVTEKDTSSGRDIREYICPGCGYSDWEDNGMALWQILSNDRQEAKAEKADRSDSTQDKASSLRGRIVAWLTGKSSLKG